MCSSFATRDVVRGEVAADAKSFLVTAVVAERVGEVAVDEAFSLAQVSDASPGPAVAYVRADGLVAELFPLSSDGRLLCFDSPMTGPGLTAEEFANGSRERCATLAESAGYTDPHCDDMPTAACAMRAAGNSPKALAWAIAAVLSAALLARRWRL